MVDLNFTIVVQLLMFLMFLWVMNKWVLRPLLVQMDQREAQMTQDKESAESSQESAAALEDEYAAAIALAHRRAHQQLAEVLREAQLQQAEECDAIRRTQETEVAAVREELLASVERERDAFPELSRTIALTLADRLDLGGKIL